jgi:hypothetical protein
MEVANAEGAPEILGSVINDKNVRSVLCFTLQPMFIPSWIGKIATITILPLIRCIKAQ